MWQEEMKWTFNPFWLAPERMRWVYPTYLGLPALFHKKTLICWQFVGQWHDGRQQNLTDTQNFWNLDQNKKKSKTKQGGRTGKSPKELHETESVGQAAWRPMRLLVWRDMMMMMMTKQAWSIITIIMHNDTIMSLQCLTYNWFTSVLFWCDSRRFPLSITLIVIYVFMVKCL